jgi:predicted nuclease with TOPRIM domain
VSFSSLADGVLLFAVILGGLGYASGQFFSQRRKGQSDALSVALQEVEALRGRATRLESELQEVHSEIEKLRVANETLRNVVVNAEHIDKAVRTALAENNDVLLRLLVKP